MLFWAVHGLSIEFQIGWSKQSTKIVIFASDGLIHFAGDGLLAGVVDKNEQVCRLNADGEYTAALDMDYPSLEEIYRALLRNKVRHANKIQYLRI